MTAAVGPLLLLQQRRCRRCPEQHVMGLPLQHGGWCRNHLSSQPSQFIPDGPLGSSHQLIGMGPQQLLCQVVGRFRNAAGVAPARMPSCSPDLFWLSWEEAGCDRMVRSAVTLLLG